MITNFFKGIGKGLLNIIIIPVFIVGLALSSVAGLAVFLFEFFKKVGKFFTGKSLTNDLPEDIEAKRMIEEANAPKENKAVEVVQAEIADPIASYREVTKQVVTAKAIESKEDIDFIVDDVPLEIDVQVEGVSPTVREIPSNNNSNEIEQYEPKGSKF